MNRKDFNTSAAKNKSYLKHKFNNQGGRSKLFATNTADGGLDDADPDTTVWASVPNLAHSVDQSKSLAEKCSYLKAEEQAAQYPRLP